MSPTLNEGQPEDAKPPEVVYSYLYRSSGCGGIGSVGSLWLLGAFSYGAGHGGCLYSLEKRLRETEHIIKNVMLLLILHN